MSVIQTLKGALNNVQQVGSSGIKSLKKKSHKPKVYPGVEGVDLDAGADLLNKYQQQWAEMHQRSDHNARAAQRLDQTLRGQYDRCEEQTEAMNQLMSLVSGLPHLLKDINTLVDKIGAIQEQFQQVEDDLVTLTDVSEAVEMKTNQRHHHHQLAVYKQRKARDLEQDKVQLANEHAKKVEGYEAKLQEHLRVKQEAFEEAFAKEMANYKQYGSTDMKPLLSRSPQHVELADISIDQDTSALNAFLDSDDGTSGSSPETITIEEDEDDEDSYVNIGIVSNALSDPEVEVGETETENTTSPKQEGANNETTTTPKQEGTNEETETTSKQEGTNEETETTSKQEGTNEETETTSKQEGTNEETETTSKQEGGKKETKTTSKQEGGKKETKTTSNQEGAKKKKTTSKQESASKETKTTSKQEGGNKEIKTTSKQEGASKETKTTSKQEGGKKETKTTSKQEGAKKKKTTSKQEVASKETKTSSKQEGAKKKKTISKQESASKETETTIKQEGANKETEMTITPPQDSGDGNGPTDTESVKQLEKTDSTINEKEGGNLTADNASEQCVETETKDGD